MTDVDLAPEPEAQPPPAGKDEGQTPARSGRAARNTIEWILIVGAALAVALVVKTYVAQVFYIPSASMEPRLEVGDRVLVNKVSYRLHEIHRGDVVVFGRPDCDTSEVAIKDLIKRVIGLEGETVEGRDGRLLVNGRELTEPYLPEGETTSNFGPVRVPADHLWVMGDNRSNSKDSRFLCNNAPTFIAEDEVVGRAFLRVWPPSELSGI